MESMPVLDRPGRIGVRRSRAQRRCSSGPAARATGHVLDGDTKQDGTEGERIILGKRRRNERAQQADRLLPEMALLVFVDDVEAAVHEDAAPVEQVLDLADLECDRPPAVLVLGQDLVLPPVGGATVEPALRVDVADW